MNISIAASRSGVSTKMIRYYEQIGLTPEAGRGESNYRVYDEEDVARLRFIHRARQLGFSVGDIRELLGKWSDPQRQNAEVRALAAGHITALKQKAAEIQLMIATLESLSESCRKNSRSNCMILDALVAEDAEMPALEGDRHHFGQLERLGGK